MTTTPDLDALRWRALMPDDIDLWFALVAESESFDVATERHSRAELAELFDTTWRDPARDSIVGLDRAGVAQAFGWVDTSPAGHATLTSHLWGTVHPRWRGRGVGQALLSWQVARAREALADVGTGLPRQILAYAQESHGDRFTLLETAGFRAGRWFVDMRRPLSTPPPDRAPAAGIEVRPWSSELNRAVLAAHNEAFADHWGSAPVPTDRWEYFTLRSENFRPDWSFVAVDLAASTGSPIVAGYALNSAYPQGWAARGHSEGWTDLLGTMRAYRGRGVATAVLSASLRAFRESGMAVAGLSVDTDSPTGALGLYQRLGYEPQERSAAMILTL